MWFPAALKKNQNLGLYAALENPQSCEIIANILQAPLSNVRKKIQTLHRKLENQLVKFMNLSFAVSGRNFLSYFSFPAAPHSRRDFRRQCPNWKLFKNEKFPAGSHKKNEMDKGISIANCVSVGSEITLVFRQPAREAKSSSWWSGKDISHFCLLVLCPQTAAQLGKALIRLRVAIKCNYKQLLMRAHTERLSLSLSFYGLRNVSGQTR